MNDLLNSLGLSPAAPALWLLLAALAAAGFVFARWRSAARRSAHYRAELERARLALTAAETRLEEAGKAETSLSEERTLRLRLEAEAAANEARLAERTRALEELKDRMETEFRAATAQLLEGAHKSFLERANETFVRHHESAAAEGEKRRKALDDLLKPVSETLVRYQKGLDELRKEQTESRGALSSQIGELAKQTHDVRAEAQKLATALRAGPKTRGRWGEEQLRNVVEIAGMAAHVDFVEQASHHDGEQRKQPDMVVRLPGSRVIAIDSKVSLGAYLDAVEAETDEARTAHLARHAEDLWKHVQSLSKKDYAASLRDSLDYVVMFVPGENYFSAALDVRPELYRDAFDRKILIASPTILIAMLKSAALNWRQEKMTEHAQAVAAMAKDLYDSLRKMGENVSALGKALNAAVSKYNATVGGLEQRVMPRARKFADYEIPGVAEEIAALEPLETALRSLRADKDLLLPGISDQQDDAA